MFIHVARLKYREESDSAARLAFEQKLRDLPKALDTVQWVVATEAANEPDVAAFVAAFGSVADFHEYLHHPAHETVALMAKSLVASVVRLDFEVDHGWMGPS